MLILLAVSLPAMRSFAAPYALCGTTSSAVMSMTTVPDGLDPTALTESLTRLPQTLAAILAAAQDGGIDSAMDAALEGGPALPAVAALAAIAALQQKIRASLPKPPPSLLDGTVLSGRPLECVYRASRDGWSATKFHKKVDYRGPAIMLATDGGSPFGGYNPSGWLSTDDYYASNNAFLIVKKGGEWIKLPKLGGSDAAVFDYARSGPHFGSNALIMGNTEASVMGLFAGPDVEEMAAEGNLRRATSQLGLSFARGPYPYAASVFGGRKLSTRLLDIEVWADIESGKPREKFKMKRI